MATNAEIGKNMAQNFPKASLALADIHTATERSISRSIENEGGRKWRFSRTLENGAISKRYIVHGVLRCREFMC